jgi:putative endonuclease
MYYTYLAECADKTLYCGYTDDVKNREKVHNSGKGAKYTRSRLPVKIVYYEEFETKSEALKREHAIKKLTREEKEKLIKNEGD